MGRERKVNNLKAYPKTHLLNVGKKLQASSFVLIKARSISKLSLHCNCDTLSEFSKRSEYVLLDKRHAVY